MRTTSLAGYSALSCSVQSPTFHMIGPVDAPVILALGGISATRHITGEHGWWPRVAGHGCPLDTAAHRVLGIDFLDGGEDDAGHPAEIITTVQQAEGIVSLLDSLGIDQLDAVVGASYGGMVALALAEKFPERVRQVIAISAPHETSPFATALRSAQRDIVKLGLEFGHAERSLAVARAVAMTTYRTAEEFTGRFTAAAEVTSAGHDFPVAKYLRHAGERFASRTRASRFLALSLSADLHSVHPENIDVPVTVIAAEGDTLVPVEQLSVLAARLQRRAGFHVMRTPYGHDAFLTEPAQLGALITRSLHP